MKQTLRRAAIGVSAVFCAATFAAPALAAETTADMSVKITGTTWTAGATKSFVGIDFVNNGPQTATGVTFDVDLSGLDKTKVDYSMESFVGCMQDGNGVLKGCTLEDLVSGDIFHDGLYHLGLKNNPSGSLGTVKVTVHSAQDENLDNNTATAEIVIKEQQGVDLAVGAYDITQVTATGPLPEQPVQPGASTEFWAIVANFGNAKSTAVKMEIKLPAGVTFDGTEDDCDYKAGSTSTTCVYAQDAAQPKPGEFLRFYFPVKVGADVVGPTKLTGGVIKVTDVPATPEIKAKAAKSTKTFARAGADDIKDLDPSDNSDLFKAWVAKKSGGNGGGLPVTGANTGLIAGIGGGVLLLGAALFFMARRRRVTA